MSSDDTVQFTDIDSDSGNRDLSEGNFIQTLVTINVFGASAVTTGGNDTMPAAATTTSSTGISGSSDSVISLLESQIAALSYKVKQPQPRVQADSGQWRTKRASTSQPVAFSKRFESAPRGIVSIFKADLDRNKNFRLNVYATDIDPEGFTVHADIWADTILFECGVSWVAVGNGKE